MSNTPKPNPVEPRFSILAMMAVDRAATSQGVYEAPSQETVRQLEADAEAIALEIDWAAIKAAS